MSSDCVPLPQMEATVIREARKTDRIAVRRNVEFRTSDGWPFTALCTDVNLSGVGIDSDHVLKVGQRVNLQLREGKQIPMIVIYRMASHYGLSALASLDDVLELLPIQG